MCDEGEFDECKTAWLLDRQEETINKLLGRIEGLKAALRGTIDAHASNAGEWVNDERIINAQRALGGKV